VETGHLNRAGFLSDFGIGNDFGELRNEKIHIAFNFTNFSQLDGPLIFIVFVYWKLAVLGTGYLTLTLKIDYMKW